MPGITLHNHLPILSSYWNLHEECYLSHMLLDLKDPNSAQHIAGTQ